MARAVITIDLVEHERLNPEMVARVFGALIRNDMELYPYTYGRYVDTSSLHVEIVEGETPATSSSIETRS